MKISTKGRYALRLMIVIASKDGDAYTTLREVSEDQSISVKYLEQLVGSLTDAGLLVGHRGIHGGYSMAKPADQISVGDILRASEGGIAPVACLEEGYGVCPRRDACETLSFWQGLDDVIAEYVDGVKLSDLVNEALGEN